ncbi:hypothetical protein P692DRAFT_20879564 [Suillus brevipes Sb2]|nr:hypothetical protein P692DRAFT_20879564 [Suillus brevipes Sb2]
MSLPLLRFLQMNCDIDFDNVVLSDPSMTESSSSPYLTASDNMLLDPAYWIQHPPRFRYLMQQISTLLPSLEPDLGTHNHNWVADLFFEDAHATTPAKAPIADSDSITEPESEDVTVHATTPAKAPVVDSDSITEPESEDLPVQATTPAKATIADSTGSITEPESEEDNPTSTSTPGSMAIPPRLERLNPRSFFSTPSPPPPNSIYWKYVTPEEDAKWYDHAGVDESFSVVRQRKRELQALCDNE